MGILVAMLICYPWLCALSCAPQVFDRMSMWIKWWNHDMLVYVQAYALQVFDKMSLWMNYGQVIIVMSFKIILCFIFMLSSPGGI